jgi:hypothetical protein
MEGKATHNNTDVRLRMNSNRCWQDNQQQLQSHQKHKNINTSSSNVINKVNINTIINTTASMETTTQHQQHQ